MQTTITNLWQLARALYVAVWGHRHQRDKAGQRYVWHLLRVAWLAYGLSEDLTAAIVGLLHDAIEDGIASSDELRLRFGWVVSTAVMMLTRPPDTPYGTYIVELAQHGNRLTVTVKLADLLDNANAERLRQFTHPGDAEHERLLNKYLPALWSVLLARTGV